MQLNPKLFVSQRRSQGSTLAILLVLVLVAAGGWLVYRWSATREKASTETAAQLSERATNAEPDLPDPVAVVPTDSARSTTSRESASSVQVRSAATRANTGSAPAAPAPLPPASAYSAQLIQKLATVDPSQTNITAEQATELKQNLKTLVQEGAAAVPAIRQFLERNQDVSFDEGTGTGQVGYSSLRAGLFDALKQIGGSEATATFVSTIRSTADPTEIATLARYLEEQAPGQYRQEAVNAARDTLEQAARGQLAAKEVAPLFQVLQNYGDANAIADLEKSMSPWHYYATMALAGMPDGQGISALRQRVQEAAAAGRTPNSFSLQMLAQMAAQYPDAATALVEQAKQNIIPERAWTKIVEGLAGDQYQLGKPPAAADPNVPLTGLKTYHIESGNQNFYSLPFNIYGPPDQAAQRRAVVDQLLSATQNPAALQALQNARSVLSAPAP